MEKTIIIANWKMNPCTFLDAQALISEILFGAKDIKTVNIVFCPPFVYLQGLIKKYPKAVFGAQDCFWEQQGAFTGEVSPQMLKAMGCAYVILGHSERAKYLGETEDMVQKKVAAALAAGLKVILCVGEKEETPKDLPGLIVVYEPEWAISTEGSGAADTESVALRVAEMRRTLKTSPILYGGSVTSSNIASLIKETGVQGALVGSASLDACEFFNLVKNAAA